MEDSYDCTMDEVATPINKVKDTNFIRDGKGMKELDLGSLKIPNSKRNMAFLITKEQGIDPTLNDEKLAMIRELTREVHKVVKENQKLKMELNNSAQRAAKDQEELRFILNQRKSKEMDAFNCFTAALQAKNHVLEKISKELGKTKEELAQLTKTAQTQALQYRVNLEIIEEKYQSSLVLKDGEIRRLSGEVKRQSTSSTPPPSPLIPEDQGPIFIEKRRVLQQQVEDMCRIIDSQTNNQANFFDQIENRILSLTQQNAKLEGETLQLNERLAKKEEELKRKLEEFSTKEDTKRLVSKESLMQSIKENIIKLIQEALREDDDQSEKSLIRFLRDMRIILRQVRRRLLTGGEKILSDEERARRESIKETIINLGKDCGVERFAV